jgi:hypothetical protein
MEWIASQISAWEVGGGRHWGRHDGVVQWCLLRPSDRPDSGGRGGGGRARAMTMSGAGHAATRRSMGEASLEVLGPLGGLLGGRCLCP